MIDVPLDVIVMSLCLASAAIGGLAWWSHRAGLCAAGRAASLVTALVAIVAWIVRFSQAGHMPIFGTYESALSLAMCTTLLAAALDLWRAPPGWLAPPVCAVAAGVLAHGRRYDATPYALTISERSLWVEAHALVAWLAFGVLCANGALALCMVMRLPGASAPRMLSRTLSWGFLLHSGMLVSGSFYKFLLFGRAWSFDPIESMALVVWLGYGTLLHLHLFAGWDGARLARFCLLLFVMLLASYRLIVYFPPAATYHIFDMDRRVHVMGS